MILCFKWLDFLVISLVGLLKYYCKSNRQFHVLAIHHFTAQTEPLWCVSSFRTTNSSLFSFLIASGMQTEGSHILSQCLRSSRRSVFSQFCSWSPTCSAHFSIFIAPNTSDSSHQLINKHRCIILGGEGKTGVLLTCKMLCTGKVFQAL